VPNNNIVWFAEKGSTTPLSPGTRLNAGNYYAIQNTGGACNHDTATVLISLDGPGLPEAPAEQIFCEGATIADLVVFGGGIVWYDSDVNGNKLLLTHELETATSYWAVQTSGDNCEGAPLEIVVTIIENLGPPIINTPQAFCDIATIADLSAQGTNLKWYDADGNVLLPTHKLKNDSVYYVTQSTGNCESSTSYVKVIIDNTIVKEAPQIADQTLCAVAYIKDIIVPGFEQVDWFISNTDPTPLNLNDEITSDITLYAAYKSGLDCDEAPLRKKVQITFCEQR
jgi:hypothetical protein